MSLTRKSSYGKELIRMPGFTFKTYARYVKKLKVENPPKQKFISYKSNGLYTDNRIREETKTFIASIRLFISAASIRRKPGKFSFERGQRPEKRVNQFSLLVTRTAKRLFSMTLRTSSKSLSTFSRTRPFLKFRLGLIRTSALKDFWIGGLGLLCSVS